MLCYGTNFFLFFFFFCLFCDCFGFHPDVVDGCLLLVDCSVVELEADTRFFMLSEIDGDIDCVGEPMLLPLLDDVRFVVASARAANWAANDIFCVLLSIL